MSIQDELINQFNEIIMKIYMRFIVDVEKPILKFTWKETY